jgi:hypothetical protein
MPPLLLTLATSASAPVIPVDDVFRLTCQIWKGGRAVGGTLDPALRGNPDGPEEWCVIADHAAEVPASLQQRRLEQINPGDRLSPDGAGALFVVAMDIQPSAEDEFNDWYNTEHIPLLSAVPGVVCARRFRAMEGSPRYVAIYHLTEAKVYASTPWREADQTPWIGRMRRFQSNRQYFMFYPPSKSGIE